MATSLLTKVLKLGSGGPLWKNSSGKIQARTTTDGGYAKVEGATATAGNELVTYAQATSLLNATLPSTTVSGELVTYGSVDGHTLTRASATGVLKATAGVVAACTGVTDDAQIKAADFPGTLVDGELPVFSGTTGKAIKRANGLTGIPKLAAGVVAVSNVTDDAQIKASDFPGTLVDGELPVFSGTTGKVIKRVNALTGVPVLTAGVVSIATGVTDDAQIKAADFPGTCVDQELFCADGTTGKKLKRVNALTGICKLTAGVVSAASGVTDDAQIKSSDFPSSVTDAHFCIFDGTTGKKVKELAPVLCATGGGKTVDDLITILQGMGLLKQS